MLVVLICYCFIWLECLCMFICIHRRHHHCCNCIFYYVAARLHDFNFLKGGRVEVLVDGTHWVSVCDVGFDAKAASVSCRSFDYNYSLALTGSIFGPLFTVPNIRFIAAGHFLASIVHCDGNENSLADCTFDTSVACPSGNYASVLCFDEPVHDEGMYCLYFVKN